ncbi:MAG: cytochrome c1 [Pseudomonadota bacterium]
MKNFYILLFAILFSFSVFAEGTEETPKQLSWQFSGMTGYLDKKAAQRGFQIYSQVCSTCHAMKRVSYRNLAELGFKEEEIKAVAASKLVEDYDEKGQRIQRQAKLFDSFVPPYPNEEASRAANNGAYPPDLSLIVKARKDGANYVYSLITGFKNPPENEKPVKDKYYNPYFPNHWISMPPPLSDGVVSYQDGTPATIDQMAKDVVVFLQWAAEPEMEERKRLGIKVLLFLSIFTTILYLVKRRIWRNVKH